MKVKLKPEERIMLLKKRDTLVAEVQGLKALAPIPTDPAYMHRFYQEDLNSRAKKILAIDRKLGR